MASFSIITKKVLDKESNNRSELSVRFRFGILISKNITIQNKYKFFYKTINNIFLTTCVKEEFIENFCKITRAYYGFLKLASIYRDKYYKSVVNVDMGLNEICENQKNVISVIQNGSKHLFTVNDINNIIQTSLTNNNNFFAEPLCIKNPYNNLPFTKSNLYNIYFLIKYKTHSVPVLFYYFFKCNFNISVFADKYDYLLREYAIENYVYKSTSNTIMKEITNMLMSFNSYCQNLRLQNNISIDNDFPKEKLIKIMRPYLIHYIISKYSFYSHKKNSSDYIFKKLLLKLNKFNPLFGRKKYKIITKYDEQQKRVIVGKITEFNDNHIKFNDTEYNVDKFLTDHLIYTESVYYDQNQVTVINFPNQHFIFNQEEYGDGEHQEEEEEDQEQEDQEDQEQEEEDQDQEQEENLSIS